MDQEIVMPTLGHVNVIGLGYTGLPTAILVASRGFDVTGVDVNPHVVDSINRGEVHIVEPDLDGLLLHVVKEKRLKAQLQPCCSDIFFISVPTPLNHKHEPDISFVESAARSIVTVLKPGNLVILESTSPVGTTEKIADLILDQRPDLVGTLQFAYCPERVLPGRILYELEHNDRIIGGIDAGSTQRAVDFYAQFVTGTLHATSARVAELCKLTENAYRDTNIAFANELSMICHEASIDVQAVIDLANRHPRVQILQPGPGVGGHCIAVDPWFLVHDFPTSAQLIRKAREVNVQKMHWVVTQIQAAISQFYAGYQRLPKVACMGLSYKPDIDDLRESPALEIAQTLVKLSTCEVWGVEPHVNHVEGIVLKSSQEALEHADIAVVLVQHSEFKTLQWPSAVQVLDFCGIKKVMVG